MNPSTQITTALTTIKERAEKATPGPWKLGHRTNLVVSTAGKNTASSVKRTSVAHCYFTHSDAPNKTRPTADECGHNAAFIAASRSDIVRLVRALEHEMETSRLMLEGHSTELLPFLQARRAELAQILTSRHE